MKGRAIIRSMLHWRSLLVLALGLWAMWTWFWHVVDDDDNWTKCVEMKPGVQRRLDIQLWSMLGGTLGGMYLVRRRSRRPGSPRSLATSSSIRPPAPVPTGSAPA